MPHFTIPIDSDGPVIDVAVALSPDWRIARDPTVFALIGRDLLALTTLFYNGPATQFTLSC